MSDTEATVLIYRGEIPHRVNGDEFNEEFGNNRTVFDESQIPNLEKDYQGFQHDYRFPNGAIAENIAALNGGWVKPTKRQVQSPYIAETQINLFNTAAQPALFPPWEKLGGNIFKIPIANINTIGQDVPAFPCSLTPVSGYERAYTSFMSNRPQSQHGLLKGSFEVLVRVGKDILTQEIRPPNAWLMLTNTPSSNYEHRNAVGLAMDGTFYQKEIFKLDGLSIGQLLPTYAEAIEYLKDTPELNVTWSQGKIDRLNLEEKLSIQMPHQRTTDWIPVNDAAALVLKPEGTFTHVCRIQWKDEFGEIRYDQQQSDDGNLEKIVHVPTKGKFFRCWFAFDSARDSDDRLRIWKLPIELSPYHGYWAKYTFNVNTDVVFEPSTEYWLELRFFGNNLNQLGSDGFIIQSGGLSFLTNVKDILQTKINGLAPETPQ